ncbi:uncharacterized protein LOC107568252 [Tachysurus ichikawai]
MLAKEHLIQEVAKAEGRRAFSAMPEENEAAAEPVSKAPHHEACSSLDNAFEEILQERHSQGRSVDSERIFSAVANVLDENRNRLKPDKKYRIGTRYRQILKIK